MSRVIPLFLFSTVLCLMAAVQPRAAHASTAIPEYFYKAWTVSRDCTELHAGPSGHANPGLKFSVSRESLDGDSHLLMPVSNTLRASSRGWNGVKLEYRAGARMTAVPADMECVPGQEASSSFLAQSGFSSSAEPYYGYEHWYGKIAIHGEMHHLLIFPRDGANAVVMIIDADAGGNLQLDHNGTIIIEN